MSRTWVSHLQRPPLFGPLSFKELHDHCTCSCSLSLPFANSIITTSFLPQMIQVEGHRPEVTESLKHRCTCFIHKVVHAIWTDINNRKILALEFMICDFRQSIKRAAQLGSHSCMLRVKSNWAALQSGAYPPLFHTPHYSLLWYIPLSSFIYVTWLAAVVSRFPGLDLVHKDSRAKLSFVLWPYLAIFSSETKGLNVPPGQEHSETQNMGPGCCMV